MSESVVLDQKPQMMHKGEYVVKALISHLTLETNRLELKKNKTVKAYIKQI